jgi:hypothetical protein
VGSVFISAQNSTLPHSMRSKRRKLRSGSANSLIGERPDQDLRAHVLRVGLQVGPEFFVHPGVVLCGGEQPAPGRARHRHPRTPLVVGAHEQRPVRHEVRLALGLETHLPQQPRLQARRVHAQHFCGPLDRGAAAARHAKRRVSVLQAAVDRRLDPRRDGV